MWTTAVFFALFGALRGWQREMVATAGILLGFFAIFQFDSLLRGSLYLLLTDEQTFLLQLAIFIAIVVLAYRKQALPHPANQDRQLRNSLIGALIGFFNGYLVAGFTWTFLDINCYPFAQLLSAPAEGSVSFNNLGAMPIVLLGGGTGDVLALVIMVILAIVIVIS